MNIGARITHCTRIRSRFRHGAPGRGSFAAARILAAAAVVTLAACAPHRSIVEDESLRPANFVELRNVIPELHVELRYLGSNNFVGRPIDGYEREVVWLTEEAAAALASVQRELSAENLALKVFDGYRPQRAVDDFMRWAADSTDMRMKAAYYPAVEKSRLVPDGYIAARSGHSRGSTVDVTLIEADTGAELDMGSPWDFFDPISAPASNVVSQAARANRMKLRQVMLRHGFAPLEEEWWHFSLREEPYPDTYFDFPVR